jgi:hypothetical protein
MMYGFVIEHERAVERGIALYGSAKTEYEEDCRASRYAKKMISDSARVWRRTRFRGAKTNKGHFSAMSLAENTSESAMLLPPREVNDMIKLILETEEEPGWYKIFC